MATTVFCSMKCKWVKDMQCQRMAISIDDSTCQDYSEFPAEDPEYQDEYWVAIRNRDTGKIYREKRYGKRCELYGMTLYTRDDIRYGIDEADFTEARTGYLIKGDLLCREDVREEALHKMGEIADVMSYPEMEAKRDD